MKKSRAIEFWRFMFTMYVVMAHAWLCTSLMQGDYIFSSAGYSVEFFFLLSGFLLAYSCQNKPCDADPAKSAVRFTWKRFLQFAPMYYLTLVLTVAYRCRLLRLSGQTSVQISAYVKSLWRELFMLNGVLYYDNQGNIVSWYLSVLVFMGFFVYLLVSAIIKYKVPKVIPLAGVGLLLCAFYYSGACNWALISYNTRGTGCLLLGTALYFVFERIKNIPINRAWMFILAVIEGISIVAMLSIVPFRPIDRYTPLVLIPFGCVIIFSFWDITPITHLLNNKFAGWLGKISMGIYMGQMVVLLKFGWNAPFDLSQAPVKSYTLIAIYTIAFGVVLTMIIAAFRYVYNRSFKQKIETKTTVSS